MDVLPAVVALSATSAVTAIAPLSPVPPVAPHAVSRLRTERLARSTRPFLSRGGPKGERCAGCRMRPHYCLCAERPMQTTHAGMCLVMHDAEPLKPSNTGWLIADVVTDTFAFGWARTAVDPQLLALLADPQWQPYVVFPGDGAAPGRVVTDGLIAETGAGPGGKRPLFILLDGTWSEAHKMFRKSPCLDHLPVLSLQPEQLSRYRLRRAPHAAHLCTSEVAALCLELAGEAHAALTLEAYLDVFTHHYLQGKNQQPLDTEDALHQRLRALARG